MGVLTAQPSPPVENCTAGVWGSTDAWDTETTPPSSDPNWYQCSHSSVEREQTEINHHRSVISKPALLVPPPLQVKVLLGHRVVQVACGSRDAQTLALTDEGTVVSGF